MNYLLGKFTRTPDRHGKLLVTPSTFDSGYISLSVCSVINLSNHRKGVYYNPTTEVVCAIFGYVSNLEEIRLIHNIDGRSAVEVTERLYSTCKADLMTAIDGLFTIVLFDQKRQYGFIFQDRYGSNIPLYYTVTNTEFIFSTSLRRLLKNCTLERKLDTHAIYHFLHYRYIVPFKSTLLNGVSKLVPSTYIHIDNAPFSIKIRSMNKLPKPLSTPVKSGDIPKSVENCTASLLSQLVPQKIALTLSGGFDSNLILHILRKLTNSSLTAVTIGGKLHNEIPQATSILTSYNNVTHLPSLIYENIIQSFPDIVWRTEGYVFSHAVFLQYELATVLSTAGFTSIFLGDGADQQLDPHRQNAVRTFFQGIKQVIKASLIGDIYFHTAGRELDALLNHFRRRSRNVDYDIFLDVVLKKNGILLNSFGIQGLYPFMNRETAITSMALGKLNLKKRMYKEQVSQLVGPLIAKHISKQYGTTDIGYLFNANREMIIKVLESDIVRSILSTTQIRLIMNNAEFQPFILQLLYIFLFNELFITGRFDTYLSGNRMPEPLSSFL